MRKIASFDYRTYCNDHEWCDDAGEVQFTFDYNPDNGEIGRIRVYCAALGDMVTVDEFTFAREQPAWFGKFSQWIYENHLADKLTKTLCGN